MVIKIDKNRHGIRRETDTDKERKKAEKKRQWEKKQNNRHKKS